MVHYSKKRNGRIVPFCIQFGNRVGLRFIQGVEDPAKGLLKVFEA